MSKVDSPEQVRRSPTGRRGPGAERRDRAGCCAPRDRAGEPRVTALLVASEDMVADLGTERSRGGEELAYVRARFLVECRAAGVEAIDCPYTFSDVKGAAADAQYAKRLGYRMKSLVDPSHAEPLNKVFTPDLRARGEDRRRVREGARAGQGARQRRRRADRGADLRRG